MAVTISTGSCRSLFTHAKMVNALLLLVLISQQAVGRRFGVTSNIWSKWEPLHDATQNGHLLTKQGVVKVEATNAVTYFYTEAELDHAESVNNPAVFWKQRFHVDQTFWSGNGAPVFLYIGGEGPQGPASQRLFMYDLAKQHGALVLTLEHRFYGLSQPVPNMSTANLEYLTSEQALGDIAKFHSYITQLTANKDDDRSSPAINLNFSASTSQWVGFGGSYPGALSAWVKTKYPSLFVGTVASSAPVQPEYDFGQYSQVVGFALQNKDIGGSAECVSAITKGVSALVAAMSSDSSTPLPKSLLPCESTSNNNMDLLTYYSNIFGNFQGAVQYNLVSPYAPAVEEMCKAVTSQSDPLQALAAATALFANQSAPFAKRCIATSYESTVVAPLQDITFDGTSSMRQWIWQSCNEFGYFQTTNITNNPFADFNNLTVVYSQQLCAQAYSIPAYKAPNTERVVTNYGGRRIAATNVTFPNGNSDPWHALSVVNISDMFNNACNNYEPSCTKQSLQSTSDALVFLSGTSHCRDMYSPGALAPIEDTASVVWAHAKIAARVATYLS